MYNSIHAVFYSRPMKTVVRELEGKKPQLDDLILLAEALKADGNRQKLHSKSEYIWETFHFEQVLTESNIDWKIS